MPRIQVMSRKEMALPEADVMSAQLLPHVLPIGFAGYGHVVDDSPSLATLRALLAERKATPRHLVYGVTNLASVADLHFAEICRDLDIPLRVLLPFPPDDLRHCFDPANRTRAENIMQAALSVELIGLESDRQETYRQQGYYECALQTVQQSKLLVILGDQNSLPSSDGEIIGFARATGRAVRIIQSETGAMESLAPTLRKDTSGAELTFLNSLNFSEALDPGSNIAARWLARLDANAVLVAPQFRKLAQIPIICTALAAFVTSAERTYSAAVLVVAGLLLGIVASALPAILRLHERQALWVRIRTAAEVSRSFVALWNLPESYQVVGPEILPELSEMLLSLNFLKSSTTHKAWAVEDFTAHYLETRLIDQKDYFQHQAAASARKGRNFRILAKFSSISAIAMSAGMFIAKLFFHIPSGTVLPLTTAALFQSATIAGALLVVNDCDRRQTRYQELHEALATWEVELHAFRTWPPVVQAVNKIERALIVELLEWRSLLTNMKMPRN